MLIIGAMFPWVRLVTMATLMCLTYCDLTTTTEHQHNRIFNGLSGQELADNLAINQLAIIQLLSAQESCDQRHDDLNQLRSEMLESLQRVQNTVQEGQDNAAITESAINRTLASLEVKLTRLQQQQQDIQEASGNRESSVTQLRTSLEQRYSDMQSQLEQQRNALRDNSNQMDNLASLQAAKDSHAAITESAINRTLVSLEVKLTRLQQQQQDIQEASGNRESSVTQLRTYLEQQYSDVQNQLEQQRNALRDNSNQLNNLASLHADEGVVFYHNGRQFYLHTEVYMSWDEAQSWCLTHRGTDLAAPSGNIIHFMRKAIKHDIVPDYDAAHGIWLGATDRGQEGQWVWLNGDNFNSTFPWGDGQPNNLDNNQHCLAIVRSKPQPYMADVECSLACHFVCE